jgi:hypothetical protein
MRSIKALELLNQNRINELKAILEDEVYQESLKVRPNAKKRYTAMKKYFSYSDNPREVCQKPCVIEFDGTTYTSFTNSYSLALTTEPTGEIELFDTANDTYPDVGRLIHFNGTEKKVNFAEVLAKAKVYGYRLKKSEFYSNKYLICYNGVYFRIPLLDITYGIIDDGGEASVYHKEGSLTPMTIKTDIGICIVLPIRYDGNPALAGNIVIDISEEEVVTMDRDQIAELINRRRRQVLVHSVIYYKLDDNIISDSQWSKWAFELAELQNKYPDIAKNCWYADEFDGFEGSSGYDLPLDDPWALAKARHLLTLHRAKLVA